jgi:hypothetical protein
MDEYRAPAPSSIILELSDEQIPFTNVPPLDDGRGTKPDDKRLLAAGPLFSRDEIMADFELVKSGEMSKDELLAKYPKDMVGFIEPPPPGKLSLVVDESILRRATDQ